MFNFEVYAYLFKIKEGENFNHRRPEGSALGVQGAAVFQKPGILLVLPRP